MNDASKLILGGYVAIVIIFICWFFSSILAYILVSVMVSFLGRPIVDMLGKVRIKGRSLNEYWKAGITLAIMWTVFVMFFYLLIPMVSREFQAIKSVSIESIINSLSVPLQSFGNFLVQVGFVETHADVGEYLTRNITSFFDVAKINNLFGTLAGTISGILIALFSITFMSFFFLKDSNLFYKMILMFVPYKYEEGANNALQSIKKLLFRYFVGITFEVLIVMTLNIIGLTIIGIPFNVAVMIGLVTGITNVIPYIGPLIGAAFGISVGVITNLNFDFYAVILPTLLSMSIVFIITQLIDNAVLQPVIYGNSVYAHPMEIFLVILVAGNVAGIPGMIFAIPSYTVIRVILKEFFNKYKLVKSLTHGLDAEESTNLNN